MKVNLGCAKKCAGYVCVDIRGGEGIVKADVYDWLMANHGNCEEIKSKNLLEHLPNPAVFLELCHQSLKQGGRFELITDNAEFIPFYFPFWIRHTGIGAHSLNAYALDHCDSIHYMIFTKMHLKNLLKLAGFEKINVRRITLGSRLLARCSKT